jgi:molecular chaperone GrpE
LSPKGEKSKSVRSEEPLDFFDQLRSQVDELSKEKEQTERRAAEYLDKLKRLQADMENLQKITKRQIDTVTKQASESLLVKLLPIVDALQQAGKVTHSNESLSSEEISVGLKMLFNQLMDVLKTEGLEEIAAVGELLNPERHEVVSYVETNDVPENTIVEEVRRGYILRGKVIRPSLVVVSRPKENGDQGLEKTKAE